MMTARAGSAPAQAGRTALESRKIANEELQRSGKIDKVEKISSNRPSTTALAQTHAYLLLLLVVATLGTTAAT